VEQHDWWVVGVTGDIGREIVAVASGQRHVLV
jgi:hypothetical protein